MRNPLTRALVAGAILSLAVVASVAAYADQVAATVEASAPAGAQACNTPITITATILDVGGSPISGQPVAWSFESGALTGDKILSTPTTTNSSGVATSQVELSCSPHDVTVLAVADEARGSVVVTTSGKGLPRTDTAGTETTSLPALLLAAFAVLLGSGIILRRFAADRR